MNNFTVNAIVEMPKGSFYKYEINKESGRLMLDRPMNQKVPYNYGFIPHTLCGDGDPLDIFIVSHHSIPSLTEVKAQIFGILRCIDNGEEDDKIIAVIPGEAIDPELAIPDIIQYLHTYKTGFQVLKFEDAFEANTAYELSRVVVNPINQVLRCFLHYLLT